MRMWQTDKWKLVPGVTRDELVRLILQHGDQSKCLAHRLVGDVLWMVWERTFEKTERYIEFAQFRDAADGQEYVWMNEGDRMLLSCPQEFLDMAPVVSPTWRAGVQLAWKLGRPMM